MRRLAVLGALVVLVCSGTAFGAPSAQAGGPLGGWRPVGHVLVVDVPASAGVVLDVNPFRAGRQTLAVVLHNEGMGRLRFSTLLGRVLGEGPDGGFSPEGTLGAGWRGFAWGDAAGPVRVWTPAFDSARSLAAVDPALPCGVAADAATPLAGPFEVTVPAGARPGGQTVPSPTTAFVFGDPAGGVRLATAGGVTLGRSGSGSVRGGFALAGAVFAYGTAGGAPVLWSPALLGTSTALARSGFVSCTEPPPPAEGVITVTKELVPETDTGLFDLLVDGTVRASGVGDGGTTGPVTVAAGERTVSEAAAAGANLDDYTTEIECTEDSNAASPLTGSGASLSGIPVAAGDVWVCTVTNTLDAAALPQLGVSPASAAPGSPVALELPGGVPAGGSLALLVGGELAPVVRSSSGALAASVPLFLDPATAWPAPPSGPLDLILLSDGVPVAGADEALTVIELMPAPGAAEGAQGALNGIVGSFERIGQALTDEPGAQEQWLTALSGALEELVNGADPRSLAGVLAAADAQTRELLDAWFAASGVLAALEQYEQGLAVAADALAAGNRSLAAAALARVPQGLAPGLTTFFPTDVELAEEMQFYETAKLFGQQFIAQTNQEWSTFVGIAAGAIALVRSIPLVPVISAILAVADFAFNKLYLGLLPANIDTFELTLASALLDRGETTDAVVHLAAVNEPPPIGIQDLVGTTLNVLGLGNAPAIEGLRDALVQTAAYMLGLIQQGLSTYAGDHPELNLDIEVASVPAMRWQATVEDATLVDRISQTPAVIAGLPDEVNWQASETECGQATILARTFANTWGDDLRDSNAVLVDVECAQVSVSPGFADLPPLGTQQFTATVTGATDQSVTWTASDGLITSGGLYTAPAQAGTYTITATSVEDPESSGTATVQVRPQVAIDPPAATLTPDQQQQFTATVTGTSNTDVTWTATGGTITQAGLYTAGTTPGSSTVTATSDEDPTRSATATVTITTAPSCGGHPFAGTVTQEGDLSSSATFSITIDVTFCFVTSYSFAQVTAVSGTYNSFREDPPDPSVTCVGEPLLEMQIPDDPLQRTFTARYEPLAFENGILSQGRLFAPGIADCGQENLNYFTVMLSLDGTSIIQNGEIVAVDFTSTFSPDGVHVVTTTGTLLPVP
jgi:hypothetical protein